MGLLRRALQRRRRARHRRLLEELLGDVAVGVESPPVVERDGRLGHEGLGRFRDLWRDNVTTVGGGLTLHYGFLDVAERPCLVARQVGTVLQRQGWGGPFTRCPRCPRNV